MQPAVNIIRSEHRALASVIHALLSLSTDYAEQRLAPDLELLQNILEYITEFPDQYHHPKEDQYLFRLLKQRRPDAEKLLLGLSHEHERNHDMMTDLKLSLSGLVSAPGSVAAARRFSDAVRAYAEFHWSHMRLEEEQVLPLAEAALDPTDWAEINAAFSGHADPLVGPEGKAEFDRRFRAIVNRAPAPIGLGPSPAKS